jgi:putative cell wall-binding protein
LRTSFGRLSKSLIAGVAAGALAISGLTVALTASPAAAATTNRFGGLTRYDTARIAAEAQFPGGSASAVLATGSNFPDALSAADLAGSMGAPLLLTPTAALAPETVAALATLRVHTVFVVGGPAAVSAAVIAQLTGLGYTVPAAIAGADRYATAAAVASASVTFAPIGTIGGKKTAIVVSGTNFPDALSLGSSSYVGHLPILLTDPNTLSAATSAEITSLGVTNVIIGGGTAAVSAAVETSLKALAGGALTTTRLAGVDRFDTSAKVAAFAVSPVISGGLGMSVAGTGPAGVGIILASGLNFPDALVGAEFGVPILLSDPVPTSVCTQITAMAPANVTALGGLTAVDAATLTAAATCASPAASAATITGNAGNTFFTVAFGGAVNTPAAVNNATTNFLLNNGNALLAGAFITNLGNNTYEVFTTHVLAPGDVISINGANPPTSTAGLPVPFTSVTIGANAAPTIVSTQFFTGGHAISVQFSKTVNPGTVGPSVKRNGVALGGATFVSADQSTYTWTGIGTIIASDTLSVTGGLNGAVPPAPAGVADFLAAPLAATQGFPTSNNTVAVQASVAKTTISKTTQISWGIAVGGDILTVTAKAGGGADGAAGSLFAIATAVGATTAATPATAGGITTFTLAWPGTIQNAAALQTALNALAPFNTFFVASVVGVDSPVAASGNSGGAIPPLTIGQTTYAVAVVWSKPLVPGNAQDLGATYAVSTGLVPVIVYQNGPTVYPPPGGAPVPAAQVNASIVIYTTPAAYSLAAAATQLVPGSTTLTIHAGITDFAGNTTTSPQNITLS